MGRQDDQVKVRGQRFELGEAESVLSSCSEVRDIFITTKICDGRTELVAVTRLADPRLSGEVLREFSEDYTELAAQRLCAVRDHVRFRLPSYVIPTVWLAIEQMPRTLSGKLDRASIREWLKTKNLSSARAALDARMAVELTPPATVEERLLQSV
jgi:acyl-coenzyme A synthetase/AMP-(fatty) acid ligase